MSDSAPSGAVPLPGDVGQADTDRLESAPLTGPSSAVIPAPPGPGPREVHAPPDLQEPAAVSEAGDRSSDVSPQPTRTTWLAPDQPGPLPGLAFNLHKLPGQGEDADPILRQGTDVALIGVLDGMGGAGGTEYETPDGPRTGAYLGSRVARDAAERSVLSMVSVDAELDGPALADALHGELLAALSARLTELHAPPSRLRSRLLRTLPTTMALAVVQRRAGDPATWHCHLFWAGDSRVYLLRPDSGAQQLTVDDIRDRGDAMANLRQDSLVSNAVSAETPFTVNYRRVTVAAPCLLLAATDGCFGYLPSPMHFERTVVNALCNAATTADWSLELQRSITAVAGDDAAMAIVGVGADHDQFRAIFASRLRELDVSYLEPLDDAAAAVRAAEEQLATATALHDDRAASLWAGYKTSYAAYLDDPSGSASISAETDTS